MCSYAVPPLFKNGHIGSFFACITKPIVINVEPLSLLRYMSRIHLTSTAYHLLSDRLLWWKETHFSELSISRFSTYIRKTRFLEVRWGIWRIFSSLREVVNIPIQTLIIPPWLFLRKMIISQLELGVPVNQEALTTLSMPNFSAANRGHTVGHYTRTSRGLVDVKPCRQIICSPRLQREIYGEPFLPKISIACDNT